MPFRPPNAKAVTPGGKGRFPGFDVLDEVDRWDDVTAGVVLARLDPHPELSFFTVAEQATGLARVRDGFIGDVAAGDYGYTLDYFAKMLVADAVDCLQADVTRCGGYSVWRQVAALADAGHLQISGHCAPNLHAHVAASVPNLRHLEYFHDHHRIETMLFDGTLPPDGWAMTPDRSRPGHGLALREADADTYRVA